MILATILLSGTIAICLAVHSVLTMDKHSIWPTITLGLMGCALILIGVSVGIAEVAGR